MLKSIQRLGGSAVALAAMLGTAQAQEDCLKVMTFDWSATLISDPAQIVNNSDLLHANAAYEPLVVFDNNFEVSPMLAKAFRLLLTARSGPSTCDGASNSTTAQNSPRPTWSTPTSACSTRPPPRPARRAVGDQAGEHPRRRSAQGDLQDREADRAAAASACKQVRARRPRRLYGRCAEEKLQRHRAVQDCRLPG
jgi:hypothetical protein